MSSHEMNENECPRASWTKMTLQSQGLFRLHVSIGHVDEYIYKLVLV